MQSALVAHLVQLPMAALHLLPLPLVAQSLLTAHLAQSPVMGWHVGRFASKLQSLLAVHLEQSPVALHLGAVVDFMSHDALFGQAMQVSAEQMGWVDIRHCAELMHCTHLPMPTSQWVPLTLPVQSASPVQALHTLDLHVGVAEFATQSELPTQPTQLPVAGLQALPPMAPVQFRPAVVHGLHRPDVVSHDGLSGS